MAWGWRFKSTSWHFNLSPVTNLEAVGVRHQRHTGGIDQRAGRRTHLAQKRKETQPETLMGESMKAVINSLCHYGGPCTATAKHWPKNNAARLNNRTGSMSARTPIDLSLHTSVYVIIIQAWRSFMLSVMRAKK